MISFINFLLRLGCALFFGITLMFYDNNDLLVLQGAGLLFGISGLLELGADVIDSLRGKQTIVPFTAYGSILAATLMLIHPDDLVKYVSPILGALLILDCGNQIFNLLSLKFRTRVKASWFLTPVIVLLYGVFLLFKQEVDVLVGLSFLLFSVSEIAITIVFFKALYLRRSDKDKVKDEASTATEATIEPQPAEQAADSQPLTAGSPLTDAEA